MGLAVSSWRLASAVARSGQLPAQLPAAARDKIVQSFSSGGSSGLAVGRGQTGGGSAAFQAPPNLPPAVVHQLQHQIATYFHDVFVNAFLLAMRPTLLISVGVLLLAAISCFGIQRRRVAATAAQHEVEREVAAGG